MKILTEKFENGLFRDLYIVDLCLASIHRQVAMKREGSDRKVSIKYARRYLVACRRQRGV